MNKGSRYVIFWITLLPVNNTELKLIENEKDKKEKIQMEKLKIINVIFHSSMGSDPEVKTIMKYISRG